MEAQDTLNQLCSHWSKAIDLSEKDRKERFWDVACDIKRFYDSDHRFIYEQGYKNRFMSTGDESPEVQFFRQLRRYRSCYEFFENCKSAQN